MSVKENTMICDSPATPVDFSFREQQPDHLMGPKHGSAAQLAVNRRGSWTLTFCFVLMSIAGVAFTTSQMALADESGDRAAASRTADSSRLSSPSVAGSASTAVVRLPNSAGAQGWIGPNAHYYVAPVTRKSHSPYDGPPVPPPAPPSDLPPRPESSTGDARPTDNRTKNATNADSRSSQKMRSLASTLQVQTVQHQKSVTAGPQTALLLQNARQPDNLQPAFQLQSPMKISRPGSVTRLAAQETSSANSNNAEPNGAKTSEDSSLNLKPSAQDAFNGPANSGVQSLSRPLNQVSLADAQRLKSLTGDDLRVPEDQAATLFAEAPQQFEFPRGFGVPEPARNARQLIHNPLYFEDPNMERCGIGYGCLTEVASAVRFFGRVPVMPYLMASHPPNSCVRTLGDCPACQAFGVDAYLPPLDPHASAIQVACTVGLIFLIP